MRVRAPSESRCHAAQAPSGTPKEECQHRCSHADSSGERQTAGDQLGDAEILEAQRRTRGRPAPRVREITPVLHQQGLVEAVGRLEIGANFGSKRLFLVEWPARCEPDDEEREA